MSARAIVWLVVSRAPVVAGAVCGSLFVARELGIFLPDSVAMGLAMFPGGLVAGVVLGLGRRRAQ
jgi:hypothetical protein